MVKQGALKKESGQKARGGGATREDLRSAKRSSSSSAAATPPERNSSPAQLDRLIHERMRLAIVSALAVNVSLTFNDLKELLNTTDGNLSVHARKLEEAEYVTCSKYFDGRTPKTEYRLTAAGRSALERYLDHMESVIRVARGK